MIEIFRGDSKTIKVSVSENGAPKDLTGFAAKLSVRSKDETKVVLEKDVADIPTPEAGQIVFDLSPSDTEIQPGEYAYDVQISKGENLKHTITKDKLIITSDISR